MYAEDGDDEFAMWCFSDTQDRSVQIFDDGSIMVQNVEDKDQIIIDVMEIVRLMFPKKDKGRWISAAIMEMVSSKEYTQDEISKRLDINSYHAVRSLYLKGKIGKRRKSYYETREEAAVKYHRYATPEWYKANGITDYLMHEDGREHTQTL